MVHICANNSEGTINDNYVNFFRSASVRIMVIGQSLWSLSLNRDTGIACCSSRLKANPRTHLCTTCAKHSWTRLSYFALICWRNAGM